MQRYRIECAIGVFEFRGIFILMKFDSTRSSVQFSSEGSAHVKAFVKQNSFIRKLKRRDGIKWAYQNSSRTIKKLVKKKNLKMISKTICELSLKIFIHHILIDYILT